MMKLSEYAQQKLSSTNCHLVTLKKNGETFFAIYNGLSYWGRVEKDGEKVEQLETEFDEEDNYHPNFTEDIFTENGYEIVKE